MLRIGPSFLYRRYAAIGIDYVIQKIRCREFLKLNYLTIAEMRFLVWEYKM